MGYEASLKMRREAGGVSSTALAAAQALDARRLAQSAHQKDTTRKRALKKEKTVASKKVKNTNDYEAGAYQMPQQCLLCHLNLFFFNVISHKMLFEL